MSHAACTKLQRKTHAAALERLPRRSPPVHTSLRKHAAPAPGARQRVVLPVVAQTLWQLRPNAGRSGMPRMGPLQVRTMQEKDLASVAILQAKAFHERQALALLDTLAYNNFYAEIKDGIRKKLNLISDMFMVLVAEVVNKKDLGVLGVVEVAIGCESNVLQNLPPGTTSYSYISSMAVSSEYRRMGIATALLTAAEGQASAWDQEWCVLHVYEDNEAAVQLYKAQGYTAAGRDPDWKRWLGGRVRLVLQKRLRP